MIISFKYKFIFIKTYKTAGSSIENYLYPYLNNNDILAPTEDHSGINCWGNFEIKELEDYFGKEFLDKKIKYKMKYFAHMPIWLVKERLEHLSNKLNYDIFKNFYKFGVIRNPFDTIVSHYYWQNSSENNLNSITFTSDLVISKLIFFILNNNILDKVTTIIVKIIIIIQKIGLYPSPFLFNSNFLHKL